MKRLSPLLGAAVAAVLALGAVAVAVFVGRGTTGGSANLAAGGSRTVAVTLPDMRITPARITVPRGTHLVLRVTNSDAMTHDLALATGPPHRCSPRAAVPCWTPGPSRTRSPAGAPCPGTAPPA